MQHLTDFDAIWTKAILCAGISLGPRSPSESFAEYIKSWKFFPAEFVRTPANFKNAIPIRNSQLYRYRRTGTSFILMVPN